MTVWAHPCRLCNDDRQPRFVSQSTIAELPSEVRIVRLKEGAQWLCAVVDRSQRFQVEGLLIREVVASDIADCAECAQALSAEPSADVRGELEETAAADRDRPTSSSRLAGSEDLMDHSKKVLAAAITLEGDNLFIALVSMDLVKSPGEADMFIADLETRYSDAAVLLVAQDEKGSPTHYGNADLIRRVAPISIEELPWKEYPFG